MPEPLFWHRLQFAFTIVYHYLFPQLTMGLALLIVMLKARALTAREPARAGWDDAARFWIRIFGVNFVFGVVTGLPMEFQFGTNWARFSKIAGPVVGQTLAMESLFAFFLESSFLALLLHGEKRLGRAGHFAAALALWAGTWLSGYFIVTTNAFMQFPTGHFVAPDGSLHVASFRAFLGSPWALAEYAHTMVASVVTASFVVAAVGAFYALRGAHAAQAARFLRVGTCTGLLAAVLVAFPTGDRQAKLVAAHQPAALAAMEGRFTSGPGAGIHVIGQPDVARRKLDNPLQLPKLLSILAFGSAQASVLGLDAFPPEDWPDNIELLYYAFHLMAGLGTLMIALMGVAALLALRGTLPRARPVLWALLLGVPMPYIATTAGWITAELGRQPWLVYGVLRTADGSSPSVHAGTALFTLIGFCGIDLVLGVAFLFLMGRLIARGPAAVVAHAPLGAPGGPAEPARG